MKNKDIRDENNKEKNKEKNKETKEKIIEKNEGLLLFGNWTSRIGNIVFDYVNSVSIVSAFAKKSWVLALYQSSESIISIIFNLIGGAIADSGRRKRIIIIADLISAIACFVASFFVTGSSAIMATAVILANVVLAIVHAFSSPCFKAVIREMVKKDRIVKYNSINNAGSEIIQMVGPVISVVVIKIVGVRGALIVDAVTFLISAISECYLVELEKKEPTSEKEKKNIFKDIADGFKYLWKEKTIFFIVMLASGVNLFLAGYNLLLPYTDVILKDSFNNFYSKIMIMEAIGGIVGGLVNAKLPAKLTGKFTFLMCLIAAMGAFLTIIPFACETGSIVLSLIPFAMSMGLLTMFNINYMSFV